MDAQNQSQPPATLHQPMPITALSNCHHQTPLPLHNSNPSQQQPNQFNCRYSCRASSVVEEVLLNLAAIRQFNSPHLQFNSITAQILKSPIQPLSSRNSCSHHGLRTQNQTKFIITNFTSKPKLAITNSVFTVVNLSPARNSSTTEPNHHSCCPREIGTTTAFNRDA
ncbi:hypothetical protein M0R45_025934 [Rubus argutus]|uniref:Uncharacterized protein n=1 Tax=Rubus argutus TaxID=59490 RepID=A0AAW1WYD3_RUBAR